MVSVSVQDYGRSFVRQPVPMFCSSEDELLAHVEGRDDTGATASHVEGCADCLRVIAALAEDGEAPSVDRS